MIISARINTYSQWLSNSFKQHIGEELYPCDRCSQEELALRLYEAPIVIVSHGTEEDPVFNYANEAAQRLWEMDWDEFVRLPSRFSTEPVRREEREALMLEARRKGSIRNYQGIRISRSGKRFMISNATLWNVYDPSGIYRGQAATFDTWQFLNKPLV